jgi:hypothetical protein
MFLKSENLSGSLTLHAGVAELTRSGGKEPAVEQRRRSESGPVVPADQASGPTAADHSEWNSCTSAKRYYMAMATSLPDHSLAIAVLLFFKEVDAFQAVPELDLILEHDGTWVFRAWTTVQAKVDGAEEAWLTFAREGYRKSCAAGFEWTGRERNKSRKLEKSPAKEHSFVLNPHHHD